MALEKDMTLALGGRQLNHKAHECTHQVHFRYGIGLFKTYGDLNLDFCPWSWLAPDANMAFSDGAACSTPS